MSGVSANCYATKWHLRRGSNRNDGDDQKSRPSKPSGRANLRASDRVFGLWFVFARGSYARPPVSVALPIKEDHFFFLTFLHAFPEPGKCFEALKCESLFPRLRRAYDVPLQGGRLVA